MLYVDMEHLTTRRFLGRNDGSNSDGQNPKAEGIPKAEIRMLEIGLVWLAGPDSAFGLPPSLRLWICFRREPHYAWANGW
jgi:hypothetical protein